MIASREEIFKINPTFSTFLIRLQNIIYKPKLSRQYKEGEKIILENDKVIVLTTESAQKLNQQAIDDFLEKKDKLPFDKEENLKFCGNALYKSKKMDTIAYLNDIASILNKIRLKLEEASLLMIGIMGDSWFQNNDYPPVQESIAYLKERINIDFKGGFILEETQIFEFIPKLFWLIRCNASLAETYISFPKSKTIITICKYGIIHFEFYDEKEKFDLLNLLDKNDFSKLDRCFDPIDFDNFEGRKLNL